MFGRYLGTKHAKKAAKVIKAINELKEQDITQNDMVESIAERFNLTSLTRAFIASAFCMPDFVAKYIEYVYTHYANGNVGRPTTYAKDITSMLKLFASFEFNFSFQVHKLGLMPTKFSLFEAPEDIDPFWLPVERPVQDILLSGNALVLYKAITRTPNHGVFRVEDENEIVSICGTQSFVEYAQKLIDRTMWVKTFVRIVVFPVFETTITTDQHIYALRAAQHMFENVALDQVCVDKDWFAEGKQLFETIGEADLEHDDVWIAHDAIKMFVS